MYFQKQILSLFTLMIALCFAPAQARNWVSATAPDFKLEDQNHKFHQLKNYKGQWVVVYFYPKDDTPGCTKEAKNFRDSQQQFNKMKIQVLGISIDSIKSHKTFAEVYKLNFPILSDSDKKVSKLYDVLVDIGPIEYAKRQTFIIDPDGVIVKHYESVNADKHAAQLLKDLPELMKNYSG